MAQPSKSHRSGVLAFNEPSYSRLAIQLGEIVMAQAEAALAPVGFTAREYDALLCIADSPNLSQQELSTKLGTYAPRMVSLVDGLEARSLVERVVSSTDRRRNVLRLTDAGQDMLDSSNRLVAEMQQRLFGEMSDREYRRLRKLVERLAALPCPDEEHRAAQG